MKTLEDAIADVGGCGRFQVYHIAAINSVRLIAAWGIAFMAFGNYNPGWRCRDDVNLTSLESNSGATTGGSAVVNNNTWTEIDYFGPWSDAATVTVGYVTTDQTDQIRTDYTAGIHRTADITASSVYGSNPAAVSVNSSSAHLKHMDGFHLGCRGFTSCSVVEFDPGSKTIVTEWGLACNSTWLVTLIIFIQMVGYFCGCASAGQVSERFGRRVALCGNAALYSGATLIAIFSVSWHMYAACLFLIGIGAGGILTVALVYSFEFLDPRWRGIVGGLPLMNLSMTIFSLMAFLARDWRYIHVTMAVTSGLCLLSVFWVCESTRWLVVHGRISEAKDVVQKMASVNKLPVTDNDNDDDVMEVLKKAAGEHEGERFANQRYTYLDLFRERRLRWMTIKLALGWICEVTVYYALHFSVKVFSGNFYLNLFIYSVVEIPVVVVVGPLANHVGRKRCCAGFFLFSSLCCGAVVILKLTGSDTDARATAILLLAVAAKSAISGGRCVVTILTVELPPTVVRNLSYAFCMLFSRFGTMIAPYLIPERDKFHVSFSIMAVLMFLTGALFMSLPETNDRPMADTLGVRRTTSRREEEEAKGGDRERDDFMDERT